MVGTADTRSDEALFAAYLDGDKLAFRELYSRFSPLLTRVVGRGTASFEETTDLVQQVFLHMHRARADFDPTRKLRPWVVTIAVNVRREFLRRRQRRPEVPTEPAEHWLPRTAPYDAERTERMRQVRSAIQRLPETQRTAVELHWLEGLPFQEIAQITGTSVGSAKVRAHRGYTRLREILSSSNRPPLSGIETVGGES